MSDVLSAKMPPQLEIVVAHTDGDLNWLLPWNECVTVYYNGDMSQNYDSRFRRWMQLPNIEQESYTYLYHIISRYNSLAEVTIFLDDRIKAPSYLTIQEYLSLAKQQGFSHLACDSLESESEIQGAQSTFEKFLIQLFQGSSYSTIHHNRSVVTKTAGFLQFSRPVCFSLKKETIAMYDPGFYKIMMLYLIEHPDSKGNSYVERLWCYIFTRDSYSYKGSANSGGLMPLIQAKVTALLHQCKTQDFQVCKTVSELAYGLEKKVGVARLPYTSYDCHSTVEARLGNKEASYDLSLQAMSDLALSEAECRRLRSNQDSCIDGVKHRFEAYSQDKILQMSQILQRNRSKPVNLKEITLTMTTCKRLHLFISTVNSFINACLDLTMIDEWIVIDDNSNIPDQAEMKRLYPFITYVFKPPDLKGHYFSMNILQKMVTTPYYFHLEDDWTFIRKEKYLTKCRQVLLENNCYGQCLINLGQGEDAGAAQIYTEPHLLTTQCRSLDSEARYYIHKYVEHSEMPSYLASNNVGPKHCLSWGHYSLRVGLNRSSVWTDLGPYPISSYFEADYAKLYMKKGYMTTYLDNLYCIHTGRRSWEVEDPKKFNAYDLNGLPQFGRAPKRRPWSKLGN